MNIRKGSRRIVVFLSAIWVMAFPLFTYLLSPRSLCRGHYGSRGPTRYSVDDDLVIFIIFVGLVIIWFLYLVVHFSVSGFVKNWILHGFKDTKQ